METSFKPTGYTSLSPYLIVENAQKLTELLKKVFNATELRTFIRGDGSVQHSELQLDDSVIMISDSLDEYPPVTAVLHYYVQDVFKTFELAIKNGCEVIEQPKKGDDGDTRGGFRDFAGNQWYISTQTAE